MKMYAIRITEKTLPLITILNNGVELHKETLNHVFLTPGEDVENQHNRIMTLEGFEATYPQTEVFEIQIIDV